MTDTLTPEARAVLDAAAEVRKHSQTPGLYYTFDKLFAAVDAYTATTAPKPVDVAARALFKHLPNGRMCSDAYNTKCWKECNNCLCRHTMLTVLNAADAARGKV